VCVCVYAAYVSTSGAFCISVNQQMLESNTFLKKQFFVFLGEQQTR